MIVFRCDAGPRIGFGHLTRCRTLARALRDQGAACALYGPDPSYSQAGDDAIFGDWVSTGQWGSAGDDARTLAAVCERLGARWAVLDDYRVDESYQLELLDAGLRWLQFDGTATKPIWADILLVPNIARCASDYAGVLRNPKAQILCGPRYALVRPEFPPPNLRPPGRPVEQILMTFGGGDDRGAIRFALSSLLPTVPPDLRFLVISGAHNPNNAALAEWIARHAPHQVRLLVDPGAVAPVFASCDLAIMAGGGSTFEAACCGLPMVLITIADNQVTSAQVWQDLDAATCLGRLADTTVDDLTAAVRTLLMDGDRRLGMAQAGLSHVDGQGASRVARALLQA